MIDEHGLGIVGPFRIVRALRSGVTVVKPECRLGGRFHLGELNPDERLVQDGIVLYELGKLEEAEQRRGLMEVRQRV